MLRGIYFIFSLQNKELKDRVEFWSGQPKAKVSKAVWTKYVPWEVLWGMGMAELGALAGYHLWCPHRVFE